MSRALFPKTFLEIAVYRTFTRSAMKARYFLFLHESAFRPHETETESFLNFSTECFKAWSTLIGSTDTGEVSKMTGFVKTRPRFGSWENQSINDRKASLLADVSFKAGFR